MLIGVRTFPSFASTFAPMTKVKEHNINMIKMTYAHFVVSCYNVVNTWDKNNTSLWRHRNWFQRPTGILKQTQMTISLDQLSFDG